jgi:hypothetical protein
MTKSYTQVLYVIYYYNLVELSVCKFHNLTNKVHVAMQDTDMQENGHEKCSIETH